MSDVSEFHSNYKGYGIYKVTQSSGRVTYDIYLSNTKTPFDLVELAVSNLAIVRATINAEMERIS